MPRASAAAASPFEIVPWTQRGLAAAILIYFASFGVYHLSLYYVEHAVGRDPSLVSRLYDFGHANIPRLSTAGINDALCLVTGLYVVFFRSRPRVAQWLLSWCAWGALVSATLHSVTWIGDPVRAIPRGMWTNACCDRLISNHMLQFGLTLTAFEIEGRCSPLHAIVGSIAFGLSIIAAREHYTMDVVCSLWMVFLIRLPMAKRTRQGCSKEG